MSRTRGGCCSLSRGASALRSTAGSAPYAASRVACPKPRGHQDRDLGGDRGLTQRLQGRARDRAGQRVHEERGGERGDLRVDLVPRVHDHRAVAAIAERLLGGDVGRGPDQEAARVVQRLGRQLVVHRARLGPIGHLDRAVRAVQRFGALGSLVRGADRVGAALGAVRGVRARLGLRKRLGLGLRLRRGGRSLGGVGRGSLGPRGPAGLCGLGVIGTGARAQLAATARTAARAGPGGDPGA